MKVLGHLRFAPAAGASASGAYHADAERQPQLPRLQQYWPISTFLIRFFMRLNSEICKASLRNNIDSDVKMKGKS